MHSYSNPIIDASKRNDPPAHAGSSNRISPTQLQKLMDQSPRVTEGGELQSMINNSPRQVTQRQEMKSVFGEAAIQKKVEEEKEPLQKKENKTGMPDNLKTNTEHLSGMPLNEVKVHYNSAKPAEINALAYAQGNDIHLGPGQEKHLPHEAWHVVQQKQGRVQGTTQMKGLQVNDSPQLEKEADEMGSKAARGIKPAGSMHPASNTQSNIVQGYFSTVHKSADYRIADDLSAAVKVGYPNHILYAKSGKVAAANAKLKAAGSGIELLELSKEDSFTDGTKTEKLKQVHPKNKQNATKGDSMKLWADCGKSSAVVVGGSSRKAVYNDPSTGSKTSTPAASPSMMRAEIMKSWLTKKYSDASTATVTKTKIKAVLDAGKTIESKISKLLADYGKAATEAEKETIVDAYFQAQDQLAEKLFEYYNSLPATSKEKIDRELGINRSAKPGVGEGYTTASGGKPVAGYESSTWNFHWGGVIMESNDAKDKITLENYAVGIPSEQNTKWDIAMYGTAKKGQTFHDQHKASNLHGESPTTMNIKKE